PPPRGRGRLPQSDRAGRRPSRSPSRAGPAASRARGPPRRLRPAPAVSEAGSGRGGQRGGRGRDRGDGAGRGGWVGPHRVSSLGPALFSQPSTRPSGEKREKLVEERCLSPSLPRVERGWGVRGPGGAETLLFKTYWESGTSGSLLTPAATPPLDRPPSPF